MEAIDLHADSNESDSLDCNSYRTIAPMPHTNKLILRGKDDAEDQKYLGWITSLCGMTFLELTFYALFRTENDVSLPHSDDDR